MAASSENTCVVAKIEKDRARRPLFAWVLRLLVSKVTVDPGWVKKMRELSERGPVVHVLLRLSIIEFLLLDQLCRVNDLPPIRMVSGAGRYAFWPLRWLLGFFWHRCSACETGAVSGLAERGESSLLFLKPSGGAGQRASSSYAAEATEALVELQREMEQPVIVLPQIVFWGRRRHQRHRGPFWSQWLQQLREGPGVLRLISRILRARGDALIRMGEPLELGELLEKGPEDSNDEIAQKARFELRRRIERARKVVLGPMAKSAEAIRDEVLRNVVLNDRLRQIAEQERQPLDKLLRRARKLLREIMAVPKTGYIAALNMTLWWAWSRLFEGVEVDEEGFAKWREVAHEGPLVIVSSHKSHVDYLILSQLFWEGGIFPPHIAAGKNLSFWPIGAVFRGCGAFFIRRHFLDDEVYTAVMQTYITKILQEGYHLEFFIEGTRSRSGKMLPPKLGLLEMVVDSARRLKGYKVHVAPVSVIYGRVPEEGAHAAELEGREKKAEDIGGLLRTRHLLGRRHGVLYVNFGAPIEIGEYFREQGIERDEELFEDRQRKVISNLAYRTVHEIARVTVITPTALVSTVLLLNRRRGMTRATLRKGVEELARHLFVFGAQFSASLKEAHNSGIPEAVLDNATKFLADANLINVHDTGAGDEIYTVAPERRIQLDYYKNSTLHPLVNSLMVSSALGSNNPAGRAWQELTERVRFLSQLFKYEFIFRADAVFEVNLEQAVERLIELGLLRRRDDLITATDYEARKTLSFFASMIENFIESYWIVIRQLRQLGEQTVSEKELLKAVLVQAERMYLVGEVDLREARSKINLKNSFKALSDLGVVERREGKSYAVTEEYRDQEKLRELEMRVVSYLSH